jgi:hypothetical protein
MGFLLAHMPRPLDKKVVSLFTMALLGYPVDLIGVFEPIFLTIWPDMTYRNFKINDLHVRAINIGVGYCVIFPAREPDFWRTKRLPSLSI